MRPQCPSCPESSQHIVRNGTFSRKCDSRKIQRYKCTTCRVELCATTGTESYRQKRRRINPKLESLVCKGQSQRETAVKLKASRKTIARRIIWLANQARARHIKHQQQYIKKFGYGRLGRRLSCENARASLFGLAANLGSSL